MRREFVYLKPKSMAELFAAAGEYAAPVFIAGGTDVFVDIRANTLKPSAVIDLKGIDELSGVERRGEDIFLGALTTITELEESGLVMEHFPVFREVVRVFACYEIRNRATLGGNVARASPCADFPPVLMVLSATAIIVGPAGEREVALEDFFLGPRQTVLAPCEILKCFRLPAVKKRAKYLRVGRGKGMDLSAVSVAVALDCEHRPGEVKIALGAVAPTPIRAVCAERAIQGEPRRTDLAIAEVVRDVRAISDIRGAAEYRVEMVQCLLRQILSEIFAA